MIVMVIIMPMSHRPCHHAKKQTIMMRFMSKASMLAILTCLEDADENADDSGMETGIWCKQHWMCIS
jgi:hypothetical protein